MILASYTHLACSLWMNVLSSEATRALLSAASQQAGSQGRPLSWGDEDSGKGKEKEIKGWCWLELTVKL